MAFSQECKELQELPTQSEEGKIAENQSTPALLRVSRVLGLAGLPDLAENRAWAVGPHDTCNYIFPGKLLAGSYPGDRSEPGHSAKIRALLDAGVDAFVCLQEHMELSTRFTPYVGTANSLVAAAAKHLEFWHCPIPDGHVTQDSGLAIAVATIVDRLLAGRVVYVHCWGGHGRTGTVLCALLVKVYGISVEDAKTYFMATHAMRKVRGGGGPGHWPHSTHQYDQVKRLELEGPELSLERLAPLLDWEAPARK